MKKKIILDCDNTIGIQGCDVDDGLALLYLLGSPSVTISGITTTYGNSTLTDVYDNTKEVLKEIGQENIPLVKGGISPGDYNNEPSRFLVEMANKYPGEISILATGSLTNLGGAYSIDPELFAKVYEIVLMGGITKPLVFKEKIMKELNFSCDPLSTYNVLQNGKHVSVITGNNCLDALFTREEYRLKLFNKNNPIGNYITKKTDYWFEDNKVDYGIDGFYNWDVIAAAYMINPRLFVRNLATYNITKKDLENGCLNKSKKGVDLNLPEISNEQNLKDNIYSTWLNVPVTISQYK